MNFPTFTVADEPHLKSIKYEISSASGFPFYWINEQVDSFIKSMKCCSKPETKTLSMINVDENTGIRLKLDFGYDSLCKVMYACKIFDMIHA
jgi:hypothetical protein